MTEPQQPSQYQVTHVSADFAWATPMPPEQSFVAARPKRPATITAAFWVWLSATVLGVLQGPLQVLSNLEVIATDLHNDSTNDITSMSEARGVAIVMVIMVLVVAVAVGVPFLVGTIQLRFGKNWARVLLAVLGAITVLFNIVLFAVALNTSSWQVGVAAAITTVGLTIAGFVLMFLPPSNAYCAAAR